MNEEFAPFRELFKNFAEKPDTHTLKLAGNASYIDTTLFETEYEGKLHYMLTQTESACDLLYNNELFLACMHMANLLSDPINEFMNNIRIADLKEPRKQNILTMLKRCHVCLNMVADLCKLRGAT